MNSDFHYYNNSQLKSNRNSSSIIERTPKRRYNKSMSKYSQDIKPNKKLQLVGEFSLTIDEKLFKKINPPETEINYGPEVDNDGFKYIRIIDNGPKYIRHANPYEKTVNAAMIDEVTSKNKISFKSKAFYEKALQFSKDPVNAKMDKFNPIFYYIANPNEYRFYNLDSI
jgi:hypothetical protein